MKVCNSISLEHTVEHCIHFTLQCLGHLLKQDALENYRHSWMATTVSYLCDKGLM